MMKVLLRLLAAGALLWTVGGCASSDADRYEFMRPDYRAGSKSMTQSRRDRAAQSAKQKPEAKQTKSESDEETSRRSWSLFSKKNRTEDGEDLSENKAQDKEPEVNAYTSSDTPYKLSEGDSVGILLSGIPVPQEATDIIDDDGYIKLAYIGKVKASGLTPSELEDVIEKTYIDQKIYKQVTANVLMQAKSYFVRGEVRGPGRFPLSAEGVSLVQAVAAAGGFADFANRSNVQIIRGNKTFRVDVDKMEKNPSLDFQLEAGDIIVVKRGIL